MITVICVLKSGGIYGPSWVDRLQRGVAEHLSADHRFVCLTDMDVACESFPLGMGWPGWWSKLEAFRFAGPCLYLDLDCIVTGPLDDLVRYTPGLTMCRDFLWPERKNSSVMAWRGDYWHIAQAFAADPARFMGEYRRAPNIGDQAFIEHTARGRIDTFPAGRVVSYREHARDGIPAGASVVAFHGSPKPDSIRSGWVAEAWSA